MTSSQPSALLGTRPLLPERFPASATRDVYSSLSYWLCLVYIAGLPNFIHFDPTGKTHLQGALNATSLSDIALTLVCSFLLATMLLMDRSTPLPNLRSDAWAWRWWMIFAVAMIVATIMQPAALLTPRSSHDLPLALYRIFEWALCFCSLIYLKSSLPANRAPNILVSLVGAVSFLWLGLVWVFLPIMPHQIFGVAEDTRNSHPQLGGEFIHPSYLATFAVIAFFYGLLFLSGFKRTCGCLIALVTLVLAHTRIEQLSFVILLLIYSVWFSRQAFARVTALVSVFLAIATGALFWNSILTYLSRGQRLATLYSLDDRTNVWQATIEAIAARPVLGYGFVVGARNALKDHWHGTNWIPPHAHNEYLHAFMSGGILAGIAVVAIYLTLFFMASSISAKSTTGTFLFLLVIHFLIRSVGGPNISIAYTRAGAMFAVIFVAVLAERHRLQLRSPYMRQKEYRQRDHVLRGNNG